MSDINASECPVCAGTDFRPYKFELVQCQSCGMVLSPAIWQPQSNEMLEEEWFGEAYQPETSFWVRWFEAWNNRKTLGRLAEVNLPGRRLLEIGVGSGSFLQAAREQGFDVMGCDLSRAMCERVTRTHGISMYCGPLAGLEGEDRFDVVVMNHVLEHVNDPAAFLRDVQRLLAPGGVAHIAVPNVACWEAWLSGWTSYEPYHLSYFTPGTLRKTVSASGLEVDRVQTHESFSGWFLAVLRSLLGVNLNGQSINPNVRTARVSTGGARSLVVEHAYRLAMVSVGGGAVATTFAPGETRVWGRRYLHCTQTDSHVTVIANGD
jgi:2-polyprenyl-3-methyl-5-hydroxy-6-metoxy-1,4-benzoquinol methylase